MADDANTLLADELIRHAIYLERYKEGEVQRLRRFLRQLTDDVSSQLGQRLEDAKTRGTVRNARLEALLGDLARLSDQASAELVNVTRQQLRDLAAYEGGFVATAAVRVLPVQVAFQTVAPVQLWAAVTARPFQGRALEQWFADYSFTQRQRLGAAVRMSVVEGETVDQTIRRIRGSQRLGGADGILMGATRRSAEALARTAINHVVTTARERTYSENLQVVKGVAWRSTLDGKTSEICIARDGQVYEVDQGPRPPAHPYCRSTTVPVLKSWQELGLNLPEADPGTRASMNGQVPAAETYGPWLKRQPASFQDDVLGKAKAQAFRSGKLTVQQFVDEQQGRAYSLAELRQLHPSAF